MEAHFHFFKVSRGLRQGNPLSLLLIVDMEALNKLLDMARDMDLFRGLKLECVNMWRNYSLMFYGCDLSVLRTG